MKLLLLYSLVFFVKNGDKSQPAGTRKYMCVKRSTLRFISLDKSSC